MSDYVLSVDADVDLDEIWEHIATDSIDAADRWVEKLFHAFEALGQNSPHGTPSRGPDGLPGFVLASRRVPHHLSGAEQRPVEIVAVTQGSRDIPGFLSRRLRL